MADPVKFTSLDGRLHQIAHNLSFLPRVGERVSFSSENDWYKVTAVYHEIANGIRVNNHTVIVEKM